MTTPELVTLFTLCKMSIRDSGSIPGPLKLQYGGQVLPTQRPVIEPRCEDRVVEFDYIIVAIVARNSVKARINVQYIAEPLQYSRPFSNDPLLLYPLPLNPFTPLPLYPFTP